MIAVFALGSFLERDGYVRQEVIAALEAAIEDRVHPGGSYCPIRLEALAMLGIHRLGEYERRKKEEAAAGADANWVNFYLD